ncbi:hypothetical protein BTN60_25075 [Vibrio parahaemolyticus]|nr:hypothetical protein BTN34_25090 [Vibrio parahaemolyticus]OUD66797.1 hypothetical protein BTN60_25075 [Vibrio parahaemolyticus]
MDLQGKLGIIREENMKLLFEKNTIETSYKEELINDLLHIDELKPFLKPGLICISELIENIYSHAGDSLTVPVKWSLELVIEDNTLRFVVRDLGIGIANSIRSKSTDSTMTTSEAVKLAINGRFNNGRGMGLLSIKKQVVQGSIESFSIECEESICLVTKQGEIFESTMTKKTGTTVSISIVKKEF